MWKKRLTLGTANFPWVLSSLLSSVFVMLFQIGEDIIM
jgi:hypothetical protein